MSEKPRAGNKLNFFLAWVGNNETQVQNNLIDTKRFLSKAGSMGIGFYENRFIHLGSRAVLKRIAPARWSE